MLEVQEIEVDKLRPWENNPRINEHAVEAVAKSIKSFGFNVPILYDEDYTIIAGHTRWKAARVLGMSHVPAIQIKMKESQRKAFSIADNKTSEIADWDFPKLCDTLEEPKLEDIKIPDLGFPGEDMRKLINKASANIGPAENEIPEVQEVPITKTGDLIVLGNHRLLCADSRNIEAISFVTEGISVDPRLSKTNPGQRIHLISLENHPESLY